MLVPGKAAHTFANHWLAKVAAVKVQRKGLKCVREWCGGDFLLSAGHRMLACCAGLEG